MGRKKLEAKYVLINNVYVWPKSYFGGGTAGAPGAAGAPPQEEPLAARQDEPGTVWQEEPWASFLKIIILVQASFVFRIFIVWFCKHHTDDSNKYLGLFTKSIVRPTGGARTGDGLQWQWQ